MIAGGAAAHLDHGRSVAEVFMSAARKETDAYKIKDTRKLIEVAKYLDVDTTVEVDGKKLDRDLDEIAVEVGEKALNEWGKAEGELLFAKRAPEPRYDLWKKRGVVPRNIDREIVEIMHRTHIGVDQDYKNLMKQGTRAAIADGWGGSMLATELQDILCGTFLQQELAIITGACDAMVVDIQCIFQNLANVAKCFHTKLITT